MKTLLITGATGFIGSHLLNTLIKLNKYKIRIFIREQSNLTRLKNIINDIEVFKGDFYNDNDIDRSLKDIDIFIHLASVLGRGYKKDYRNFNIRVSDKFFHYGRIHKIKKVLFISSLEVMGGSKTPHLYNENDKPNPKSSYGKSKYEIERILGYYAENKKLNVTILRVPAVYGPEDNFDRGFIRIIDLLARKKFVGIGDMNNSMSLIYIDNLIDGMIACLDNDKSNKRTYFIADKEQLTVKEICHYIIKLCGSNSTMIKVPKFSAGLFAGFVEFLGRVFHFLPPFPENFVNNATSHYACSIENIQKDLNWKPPYSFFEGMEKTVLWYNRMKSLKK